jgi:large subunit ribosomal protein L10
MPRDADNPRADKVAVVDEVRGRFDASTAALLTEYRGLNVAAMAELRRALRSVGGDYKIYKNTLVRFAARDLGLELDEMLVGPTAIAFVEGDPVNVAKALRDFSRTNPALIVKGGLLGETVLDADGAKALAEVEPREVLLAKLAGAMAAPMVQFAGLLQALPRNLAYGIQALIDQKGGVPEASADEAPEAEAEPEPEPEAEAAPEAAADETPAAEEAPAADETPAEAPEAPADETPVAEAADETQES